MLRVSGDFDISRADAIRAQIERFIETTEDDVTLDLREVAFLDSVGIAVLIVVQKRLAEMGRGIRVLIRAGSHAEKILEITGLRGLLNMRADRPPFLL